MCSALAKAGVALIGILVRTQKTLGQAKAKLESQHPSTKILAITADVTSQASLNSEFQKIREGADKPIDILIHNAGYLAQPSTMTSADPKEWWTSFEVNILGAFNSVRAFLPVARLDATIINISTAAAHFPSAGVRNLSAYSSSKAAALKVFEFVQAEHPELHIVSMQPGVIESEMHRKHGELPPMDTRK